jgi:hypothetical protein
MLQLELGLDPAPLQALAASADWAALRQAGGSRSWRWPMPARR